MNSIQEGEGNNSLIEYYRETGVAKVGLVALLSGTKDD